MPDQRNIPSSAIWGESPQPGDSPVGEGAPIAIQGQWNTGSAAPTDEQLHMQRNQLLSDQYQKQAKVEGYLATIFGDGQDVQDPRKLSLAASAIMHLDPKMAMDFANESMRLRKESAAEDKEAFKEKEAARLQGAATLASASADTYRGAMNDYVRLGNRLPPWYSGDYNKDKPYIDQTVGSGVKASQQAAFQEKKLDQLMRLEDLIQKGAFHSQEARKFAFKSILGSNSEEVADKWATEEGIAQDRAIADKQSNKPPTTKTANTHDSAVALTIMQDHPKFGELDPKDAQKIAELAASEARSEMSKPGAKGDFASLVDKHIDDILLHMQEGPRKLLGHDIPFTKQLSVPTISGDEDYAKLAPGAMFIGPDGKKYRKPGE